MVNKRTHVSGSLTDQVYIKNTLMGEFLVSATFKNVYFLDHSALRIIVGKNDVHFHIVP